MNNEIKQKYITEKRMDTLAVLQNCSMRFSIAAKYEKLFQKDISQFTLEEIEQFYKEFENTTIETLQKYHSFYKNYTEYCIQQKFFQNHNTNFYNEITNDDLKQICKQKKIILSDEDFRAAIADSKNPMDKFLVVAAYNGMKQYEIAYAKLEHISGGFIQCYKDVDGNIVPSRVLEVDNLFYQVAWEANREKELYTETRGTPFKCHNLYGDYIVKGVKPLSDDKIKLITSRQRIVIERYQNIRKNSGGTIKYSTVRTFGIYTMILQEALRRGVSPEEAIDAELVERLKQRFLIDAPDKYYFVKLVREHL